MSRYHVLNVFSRRRDRHIEAFETWTDCKGYLILRGLITAMSTSMHRKTGTRVALLRKPLSTYNSSQGRGVLMKRGSFQTNRDARKNIEWTDNTVHDHDSSQEP